MKKIMKVFLICFLALSCFGCSSKAKTVDEVGTILSEQGFKISKSTNLKENTLTDMITLMSKSDGMIVSVFNEKKISYVYYSIGNDIYVMSEEKTDTSTSTKDLKNEYNSLLKKIDLTHDDIKSYCLGSISNVRSGYDVQTILTDCKFKGKLITDNKNGYDDNLYLESANKNIFLNAYFKDKKLEKLIFASSLYSTADKLFVYENGKITKDDGWISYIGFLEKYEITHEEFINYLTELYATY